MSDKDTIREPYKKEFKIEIIDKDSEEGVIKRLKQEKGVKIDDISDRTFENKLLDSCYKYNIPDFSNFFGNILNDLFKPSKKDREIKTKLQFFKSNKPNNRGSYISDFRISVNNEEMPFSSLDQVDYFLTNYIGFVENEKKSDKDPTKIKDPELIKKKFFNKIEKEYSHFPAMIDRDIKEDIDKEEKDTNEKKKVDAAGAGGKSRKYKKRNNKSKKNKKTGKSRKMRKN
uniref:Uncharacterized protein n=1 Tax=viral metagenome TaxID=1070528 RepID=A0A6C0F826_9ZZZZ|tara:strand:+ start:41638 stop:42324 length:687 start_codon:yes stop_codon:yes gene_type:complete